MSEIRVCCAEWMEKILNDELALSEIKELISPAQRGFGNMLLMTTLRQLTFIKSEVLPQYVKKKIPNKQRILTYILYLGTTELLFLDTPDYAVLNSYTEIAKQKTDKYGSSFVNAVLRHICQDKERLIRERKSGYFSKEFMKILKQDYSLLEIKEMEAFADIEPPLDLSFKVNCSNRPDSGTEILGGTVRLPANTKVKEIAGYEAGDWWVQDAASSLPVKCLPVFKGKKILDLCAAPGGKTAQLLDGGGIVTAVDVSSERLNLLKANMRRLKLLDNLTVICCDALTFSTNEKYDIVLADAPCSATGTFRRHPEIMNTKTINDVKKQCLLQRDILERAVHFLNSGGFLVYSTCSLAKMEGEAQIRSFLKRHPDFDVYPITLENTEKMRTKENFLRVLPQCLGEFGGIDGFFVAILQRKI